MRCAGILLTGGRSTRMGRDKATIMFGGMTLADRAAAALTAVADPVIEVGPGVTGLRHVTDDQQGPFAAFARGIEVLQEENVILLAVDLPLVDQAILSRLQQHPALSSVVPIWQDHPQPLCARWTDLDDIRARVGNGERSFKPLLAERPDITWIEVDDLDDVDTPTDLERLRDR